MVESMDPCFKVDLTTMWTENLPSVSADTGQQLVQADQALDQMVENNAKLQFEQDALGLARDAAQLARLKQEIMKNERSARHARVLHLRQENQIGAGVVNKFMAENCKLFSGALSDIQQELTKACNA